MDIKDILILVLIIGNIAQALFSRNLIPPTAVTVLAHTFMDYAKDVAAQTPSTADDQVISAVYDIIKSGLLPENPLTPEEADSIYTQPAPPQ